MANIQQTQAFYSLSLEPPSFVTSAVLCNVVPTLKSSDQQIFEARGQHIYLHRITQESDGSNRKISTILEQDVFGIVRGVTSFRIPATATDQLVIASDSGRVAMLTYDAEKNRFNRIHLETYGKSGVRRTIPGQYLASDSRGRCMMLASVEKNKVVYMLNRHADGQIIMSSPHEANTWGTTCAAICALDTGWEPPVFAALEVDHTEAESDPTGIAYENVEKHLVYYTVDMGLNHVVKSWSDTVDRTANMLFAIPGGQHGPSGVLVCCEDRIFYRHDKHAPLCIQIPRRKGPTEDPTRKRIIVAGCMHLNRAHNQFFYFLQTEDGDVFKLDMDMETDERGNPTLIPERLNLKYYDTYPVAHKMLLHKKGFLYIAAENGNSQLYHVDDLAEDPEVEPHNAFTSDGVPTDHAEEYEPTYFEPRGLTMTSLAIDIPGLHPLMKARVDNLTHEDAPQIYSIQGTGSRSKFQTIRHGLDVEVLINNSMGNVPYDNIWTFKHRASDNQHRYLLLSSSYGDLTVACSITDSVEQLENSSFLENRATIHAQQMGEDTLVQVHARGVRSIFGRGGVNEWQTPQHRTISCASANDRQLLCGLSSAELCFFMMDDNGVLQQLEDMPEMSGKITAIGVGRTPRGRQQAKWAAVGCDDQSIRILSIEMDSPLEVRCLQALTAIPVSLEVVEMLDPQSNTTVSVVHIGLESGLYLRATIDDTGELGDVRTKFLGTKAPILCPVEVEGEDCVLACSTRPWLGYNHPRNRTYTLTPLISDPFLAGTSFISPDLKGLCAIHGQSLVILTIPSIEGRLSRSSIDLNYTPRAMIRNPEFPIWYTVQSDGNTLSKAMRDQMRGGSIDEDGEALVKEKHLGLPRGPMHWASCIQAVDPVYSNDVVQTVEMLENEAALCCCCVAFESRGWETLFLAVGTGQHMQPGTGQPATGYVHIYRLTEDGAKMEFVHKTKFDQPIYALEPFNGKLAIGMGNELFFYDMGMKALLRKSRGTVVPNQIVSIQSMGNRLICGDVSESVTYVVYKPKHNRMVPFSDDTVRRWTTTASMLDYETTAGGDKFGNIWIVRAPEQASQEADEEGANGFIINERSYLNGAPYRLDLRAHFYAQDIPMSLQRTALVAGGQEILFWAGLHGTLGMFVPFVTREDVEFFTNLEQSLRSEDPPLAGRDHLMYRSYYAPVKGVIDGDLCERFMALSYDSKQKVAAEVDREVKEIERKVQEMRTRVAF